MRLKDRKKERGEKEMNEGIKSKRVQKEIQCKFRDGLNRGNFREGFGWPLHTGRHCASILAC